MISSWRCSCLTHAMPHCGGDLSGKASGRTKKAHLRLGGLLPRQGTRIQLQNPSVSSLYPLSQQDIHICTYIYTGYWSAGRVVWMGVGWRLRHISLLPRR